MDMRRGFRNTLDEYVDVGQSIDIEMTVSGGGVYNFYCIGVGSDNRISDEGYIVFQGRQFSPEKAITCYENSNEADFRIDLSKLPPQINKLVFAAAIKGAGTFGEISSHSFKLMQNGKQCAEFSMKGSDFIQERSVVSVEIYKDIFWRIYASGNGFYGGIDEVIKSCGGITKPRPEPRAAASDTARRSFDFEQTEKAETNKTGASKVKKTAAAVSICGVGAILAVSLINSSSAGSQTKDSAFIEEASDSSLQTGDISEISEYVTELIDTIESAEESSGDTSADMLEISNSYGNFSFETEDGKVAKYKYNTEDIEKRFIIKGKAEFTGKNIIFEGDFAVTVSDDPGCKINVYEGKLTLPNGDVFDGRMNIDNGYKSGTQYDAGTYTWSDGRSYSGAFAYFDPTPDDKENSDGINMIGSQSLTDNRPEGYYYFDKDKKEYLCIKFVGGLPCGAGYYMKDGKKYNVEYDENGEIIYTAKVK